MKEVILFLIGIVLLIFGADFLIKGASSLAKKFKLRTWVVGITIVAFGTTMPELMVTLFSAASDAPQIALGNIIGSNISNILLILGIMATIGKVRQKKSVSKIELPFAFLAPLVLIILSTRFFTTTKDAYLSRLDGIILLIFLGVFFYYIVRQRKYYKGKMEEAQILERKTMAIIAMIIVGSISLYFGGRLVVDGAIFIAKSLGWSQFLISATIIAVGTSIPELAVGITAVIKHEVGISIGNILGANTLNIFWTLGLGSILRPLLVPQFISFDITISIIATGLFAFFLLRGEPELDRRHGIAFLLLYVLYIGTLIIRG